MEFINSLKSIGIFLQFIAAFTGLLFYKKNDFLYKVFSIYLLLIFFNEFFCLKIVEFFNIEIKDFYNFYGVPIQFLFWYWFYAHQNFKKPKLFYGFVVIYIIFILINDVFFGSNKNFISFSYLGGCLLLFFLIIKEFNIQIRSDEIIYFYRNKMFYINLGVFLFFIGSVPFYSFYSELTKNKELAINYYILVIFFNILMNLLFTASFIWGKQKSQL